MAKKKSESTEFAKPNAEEKQSWAAQVAHSIQEKYGDGLVTDGLSVTESKKTIIPISPCLDMITGGIIEGSWVGITGPPKHSKTSLALAIAANAQKEEYGARPVYYAKIEGRLSPALLRGTKGLKLNSPHFQVIQSKRGEILSSCKWLDIISNVIRSVPEAVVIIDSFSALCDEKELAEGAGTETRSSGNKLVSQFCRMNAGVVPINNTIVIGITHQIANVSGYGPSMVERSANMWKYQRDYHLHVKGKTNWESANRIIGWKVQWFCEVSPLVPPGMKTESSLRFGIGPDTHQEILDLAVSMSIVRKNGSWYSYSYLGNEIKHQGTEGFHRNLLADNSLYEEIRSNVYQMISKESLEGQ